jgi:ribonucleoside-diphosphate reductase alpha chain
MSCRRIGIGVTGLGDFLFAKQYRYGSDVALDKVEHIIKFMRNEIYKASIEVAKEKGPFDGYNQWPYLKAKFVKKLPAQIRLDIKEHGIRNCTGMAFAPTGTLSLIADTTSGIEPLPIKAYRRSDRVGERIYIHPLYKEFIKNNEPIPDWFVDSLDLTPEEHFETTVAIQSFNDGSISKTITLPNDTTHEQLKDWILEYSRKLIGITVYRDGSRDNQIIKKMSKEDVINIIKEEIKTEETLTPDDVKCHGGSCDI